MFAQLFASMIGQMAEQMVEQFPVTPTNVAGTPQVSTATTKDSSPGYLQYKAYKAKMEVTKKSEFDLNDSSSDEEGDLFKGLPLKATALDMSAVAYGKPKASSSDDDKNNNLPSSQPSNVSDNEGED